MQGIFAARCQAWMRFIVVLALSLLVVPTAFAQGAAGAPTGSAAPSTNEKPALPEPSDPSALKAPPADAELPSEPPAGAHLPAGEAELARGLPLQKIEVAGNRRVTAADVLTYVRERVGQPFKPETLTQDVRELWNSGFFDDIEVDLERHDEGVDLRFVVRERPSISRITFEGNDEISKDDLNEGIEIKANTILSLPAVRRTVQKIRDMYAEKGYFLAEVQNEVVPQQNNEVEIKFKITEHGQVSVRRITFIGNQSVDSAELRSLMLTGNAGFFAFGSGGPFRQDAFERDIAVLSAMYYDRGFLSVSISTPRIMLTPDRNGIEVSITIDEGPRYRIRQLRVYERGAGGTEVEPIDGRRNLRMMVRSEAGQYFNRAELLEDLQVDPHAVPRQRLRQRRSQSADPARSRDSRSRRHRPGRTRPARVLRAHRNSRQFQDARQGDPPRAGGHRGRAVQRDQAGTLEAPRHGARLLRARRRLDRGRFGPGQDERVHRGRREADRYLSGRRWLLQHRELHRHGAGAASEPVRQRAEPVAAGAGQQLAAVGQHPVFRALLPRQPVQQQHRSLRPAARVQRLLAVEPRRRAHLRLPADRARAERQRHLHGVARSRVDRDPLDVARNEQRDQRVYAAAARESVQRRPHLQHSPRADPGHSRQSPVPDQRHLSVRIQRARGRSTRLREPVLEAPLQSAASITRSAPASCSS